jgi:hypothetical protein
VTSNSFTVTYTTPTSGGNPSGADFLQAEAVTLQYLQAYIRTFFSANPFLHIDSFHGSVLGTAISPARVGYNVGVTFSSQSSQLPSQQDLDNIIQTALSQPAVQQLLTELQKLPTSNALSGTTAVAYTAGMALKSVQPISTEDQVSATGGGTTRSGAAVALLAIASAAAVLVVLLIAMRLHGAHKGLQGRPLAMPSHSNGFLCRHALESWHDHEALDESVAPRRCDI